MLESCQTGKGKEVVADTLAFLEGHISTHFAAEEQAQRASAFPEYAAHKAEHDRFSRDFALLKDKAEKEGPSLPLVVQTNHMVVDWLVNHIKKDDKAFARFLKLSK